MKTRKVEVILYTEVGKIIYNLTEFEATTKNDVKRNRITNNIKGKFDRMEIKTKKWWEFWK